MVSILIKRTRFFSPHWKLCFEMDFSDGVWISISGFSDLLVGAAAKARIQCQFFTVW